MCGANEKFMAQALAEADLAALEDEVPVGAVVVKDGRVISRAHNGTRAGSDPTAHAEILAIQRAARALGDWRLTGCTLYVTLEPCAMCAGAALTARMDRVVFGAYDERVGCCDSAANFLDGWFDHTAEVIGGICEDECAARLTDYFKNKRR